MKLHFAPTPGSVAPNKHLCPSLSLDVQFLLGFLIFLISCRETLPFAKTSVSMFFCPLGLKLYHMGHPWWFLWVRPCAPNAGGPGSLPGQGIRSHMCAAAKTRHSQKKNQTHTHNNNKNCTILMLSKGNT